MPDELLKVDSTKDNLIEQIRDLREKIDELERFALTSQDIVATSINCSGDIYTVEWTDYQDISTIVGWSATTVDVLRYKKIGNLVFVQFWFVGTGDNTATTFTLPYEPDSSVTRTIRIRNNGTDAVGLYEQSADSGIAVFYPTIAGGTWTASGDKRIMGDFVYSAR